MKKTIYMLIGILIYSISATAQLKKDGLKKVRLLKIAYLTEKLDLTEQEAEKFWPIYNTYDRNKHSLRNTLRSSIKKSEKTNLLTEKDAETLVYLTLQTDKKLYLETEDFLSKISKILSYKKLLQLQIAEMEFGRKLMRKYRKKRP